MIEPRPNSVIRIEHGDGTEPARRGTVLLLRSTRGALACAGIFALVGCVDAPITADQLQENGALRQTMGGGAQAAFSAVDRAPVARRAAQISAVLADVESGPLSDRSRFAAEVGAVHLHLRADGLVGARQVAFRWTHVPTGEAVVVPGTLLPTEILHHVAAHAIAPDRSGTWTVEVLGEVPGPDHLAEVLWQRRFEVDAPLADPLAAELSAAPQDFLP